MISAQQTTKLKCPYCGIFRNENVGCCTNWKVIVKIESIVFNHAIPIIPLNGNKPANPQKPAKRMIDKKQLMADLKWLQQNGHKMDDANE